MRAGVAPPARPPKMLLNLLLTLNVLVCLALIGVVLLQRSEGGAFGGGTPTGLITARGAGDLLTRTTWILFSIFLALSLALTLLGAHERSDTSALKSLRNLRVDPSSLRRPPPPPAGQPASGPTAGGPARAGQGSAAPALPPLSQDSGGPQAPPTTGAANGLALPPLGGSPSPAPQR